MIKNKADYCDDVFVLEGMGFPPLPPTPPPPAPGAMPGITPTDVFPMPPASPAPPAQPMPGAPPMDLNNILGSLPPMPGQPPTDPLNPTAPPVDPQTLNPISSGGLIDPTPTKDVLSNELGKDIANSVETPLPSNTNVKYDEAGGFTPETLKSLGLKNPTKVKTPMEILDEERRKREWKLSNCNSIEDEKKRISCYKTVNRITIKSLIKGVKLCQGAINPSMCREILQDEINAIMGFDKEAL